MRLRHHRRFSRSARRRSRSRMSRRRRRKSLGLGDPERDRLVPARDGLEAQVLVVRELLFECVFAILERVGHDRLRHLRNPREPPRRRHRDCRSLPARDGGRYDDFRGAAQCGVYAIGPRLPAFVSVSILWDCNGLRCVLRVSCKFVYRYDTYFIRSRLPSRARGTIPAARPRSTGMRRRPCKAPRRPAPRPALAMQRRR